MALSSFDARAWAPECAVRDGRLTARVSGLAEIWVRDWFSSDPRLSVTTDFGLALRRSGETDLCWQAEGLLFVVSRRGLSSMGAAMAGFSNPIARAEDDAFLQAVAETGVTELWLSLMNLFGTAMALGRKNGSYLDKAARMVGRFGDCAFEIFITQDRLAAARKALAQPSKHLSPPAARADAVARQTLDLSVLIGGASLGLQEMKGLSIGDVIVLDRSTGDDLELTLNGRRASNMSCQLDRDDARIALRITQPSSPTD
ncbi:MAG: FliM/FliN family flagellar motor C-terminal domain-containing protein [Terricaulis sp.]